MNGMDDWNVRRKARGRIKKAQRRRQRQRATAIAIALLLGVGSFALGTVEYGTKKHRQLEIETSQNISYSMPRIQPLAAIAEANEPEAELPQLLNIRERYPDYDEGGRPQEPEDSSGGEDEAPSDEAPASLVILDDLRAAPPKSMFVRAVFENADNDYEPHKPRKWLWRDHRRDFWGKRGKKKKLPPIPEPGTGVLLGLGLTILSERRRRERRRTNRSKGNGHQNARSGVHQE